MKNLFIVFVYSKLKIIFTLTKKTNTMEITRKVVKTGAWFQVQIIQIEEVTSMVFSGLDKGIEKKEMHDTVILTFGKLFETSADAETFSKTKFVLATIKLIQKSGF